YGLIGRELWRSRGPLGGPGASGRERGHRQTVRVLLVVVLSFIVCWLPFHVGRIIYINTEDSQTMYFSQYFNIVALQLFYLSASINPILYNLISKKYRAAAWKLLRGRQPAQRGVCRNRNTEGTTGGDSAGYTETSTSLRTPAASVAKQVASSHSPGTSEKTGGQSWRTRQGREKIPWRGTAGCGFPTWAFLPRGCVTETLPVPRQSPELASLQGTL
ncbi:PREDICTED: motilin receptor, partial [Myotis davidii]|uniref:motilin receptor n=1 Tax=Myotis davidii TaxID=225400 RepID=UPI000766E5E8